MTNVNPSPLVQQKPALGRLLIHHPMLAGLPADVLHLLRQDAREQRAAPGEYLFHDGNPATHFLLVHEGRIEMVRTAADGEERVARVFEPGQFVAEAAMFMAHGRYPMSARACGYVHVYRLAREQLHAACLQCPELALRLLSALSERLYKTVNEVGVLATTSAAQRLAAYFLEQHRLQATQRIELPMAHRHLAGNIGIRPETLSRLLAQWSQAGIVCGKAGAWELRDLERLTAMAHAAVRPF